MKTLSILAALLLGASFNINAQAAQADGLYVADTTQLVNEQNTATRLKFTSRRGYQNPAVKNKRDYEANDAWQGATLVDEQETKSSKRLNRQFRSKRPHIDYQFD